MSKLNINPEKEPIPASWVPRVITGGKEPPDGSGEVYLHRLSVGTTFIAGASTGPSAACWTIIWKGEHYCLLEDNQFESQNYFNIVKFCQYHPEYEVLGHNPPKEEEDNNGTEQ